MQVFAQRLLHLPVLSLQTGQPIATTTNLLIDPDTLEIKAFACLGTGNQPALLLPADIKQLGDHSLLVNSEEALTDPAEIVRLQPLLAQPFALPGLPVVTELGRKVGKIDTYTVNPDEYCVQKLHIHRPFWQLSGHVIIDRAQVVDVSRVQVTVKDTEIPTGKLARPAIAPPQKTNP